MKSIFGIKGLALSEYAIAANAVLGIRDSGKTYTATKAAEELYDAGIPFLALDPIGVWWSLRMPGKGKGYPVVVAGGRHADLPLTVKNCGAIVRAAMEAGVSLVLDLFSMELSKADWRRIVRETVEILLHENADHGMRHIFIEEAAEFVPQRVQDGQVFAAVEKLVRMGGNSKLGCTLINQRSADLNKSVLELCANVFVHRQTGKNTLLDLKKWLEIMGLGKEDQAKIGSSLPNLESGNCWVLSTELKAPVLLKVSEKNSQHPDRRAVTQKGDAKRKLVDAHAFVEVMKEKLPPKAAPVTPARGTLRHSADLPAPASDVAESSALRAVRREEYQRGHGEGEAFGRAAERRDIAECVAALAAHGRVLEAHLRGVQDRAEQGVKSLDGFWGAIERATAITASNSSAMPVPSASRPAAPPKGPPHSRETGTGPKLAKAERAILGVLAHFPTEGASKAKVAVMAGYSPSGGGFGNALSSLRTGGLLAAGEPLRATAAGLEAAGVPPPLLTGVPLLAYWLGHRALGKAERMILDVLAASLPNGVEKEDLAHAAGYEPSGGGFGNALSRLRTLELISGTKELRAAEEFAQ